MRIETTTSNFNESKYRSLKLIKTDKNGSKLYAAITNCSKCGGRGRIEYFYFYDNGVCFDCMGSGIRRCEVLVRTDEYARKLEEKRVKKQEEKQKKTDILGIKEVLSRMSKRVGYIKNCKNGPCKNCKHKSYCSMIKEFIKDYTLDFCNASQYCPNAYGNLVEEMSKTNDEYKGYLQEIIDINNQESTYVQSPEETEILTLDGKPCRVSKWYTTEYGECRTVFLPNGEKIYTGAKTNRGLNKKGLMLNPNYNTSN